MDDGIITHPLNSPPPSPRALDSNSGLEAEEKPEPSFSWPLPLALPLPLKAVVVARHASRCGASVVVVLTPKGA
jgi:hypothetical protein